MEFLHNVFEWIYTTSLIVLCIVCCFASFILSVVNSLVFKFGFVGIWVFFFISKCIFEIIIFVFDVFHGTYSFEKYLQLFFNNIFGFFKVITILSAVMVVNTRNPVHAVLFLILVFINSAPIFLMFKAEFLAFVLVIVYVGAIAVLFLFVVMLLDIKILDKKRGLMSYYPPGVFIVISLAVLFYKVVTGYYYFSPNSGSFEINYNIYTQVLDYSNLQVLGLALFNYYPAFLLLSSCILMVVVIGSVVLTSVKSTSLMKKKQQDVYTQVFYESRVYFFKKNKLDRDGERA